MGDRHRPRGPRRARRPAPSCSPRPPTCSVASRTPTSTRSRSACRARCRCSTSRRSSWPSASGSPSTAPSSGRCSPGRTTSIRTCRRTTRSPSTSCRSTARDGWSCRSGKVVGIERAHLEEDTGKSTHLGGGGRIQNASHSLVDYNRAGRPAARDRRASPTCVRRTRRRAVRRRSCARSSSPSARPTGRWRRGRCGSTATCRSAIGATADFGHALRDQERQLAAQPRPGHRLRGRPPDRPHHGRRARRAADPPLERGRGAHPQAPLQGGGRGLPVLPRARPRGGRSRPGVDRTGPRGPADAAVPRAAVDWPTPPGSSRLAVALDRRARTGRAVPRHHRRGRRPGPHPDPRRAQPGRRARRVDSTRRRSARS